MCQQQGGGWWIVCVFICFDMIPERTIINATCLQFSKCLLSLDFLSMHHAIAFHSFHPPSAHHTSSLTPYPQTCCKCWQCISPMFPPCHFFFMNDETRKEKAANSERRCYSENLCPLSFLGQVQSLMSVTPNKQSDKHGPLECKESLCISICTDGSP